MSTDRVDDGQPICPTCGELLLPIVFGEPTPEAVATLHPIQLFGCIVIEPRPVGACPRCEKVWTAAELETR